jgi:hypothetical protein
MQNMRSARAWPVSPWVCLALAVIVWPPEIRQCNAGAKQAGQIARAASLIDWKASRVCPQAPHS